MKWIGKDTKVSPCSSLILELFLFDVLVNIIGHFSDFCHNMKLKLKLIHVLKHKDVLTLFVKFMMLINSIL